MLILVYWTAALGRRHRRSHRYSRRGRSDQPELNAALSDAAPAMLSVRRDQVRIVYARGGEPSSAVYDVVRRYPEGTLTEDRP